MLPSDEPDSRPGRPLPLNALRAFEAAARHLSIKAAAGELGVTPSAVSHQLRGLEEALGVDLMRRSGPALVLTPAGAALAPSLTEGFDKISDAVAQLDQTRRTGPLRLSLLPTFAAHWLSPRLAAWPFGREGFDLLISGSQALADLTAGEADVAVRHGAGRWRGLVSDLLFRETLTLVGTPGPEGEMARDRVARSNLFLSAHRHDEFARWNATLPGGPVAPRTVTRVDSTGLALQAAAGDAGLALAGLEMADVDLAAGRLVTLFDHCADAGKAYWLVYPDALARDRRVRNLRRWLFENLSPRGPAPVSPAS
ncbi:transcriptional regulator, LysR family [Hyphomonas neptunium ATCC 15444]|uniref:Transcriptional regulator, LysR family n=2 Tax=Hyphomonas TaxID=85 RepID=Q0C269_HYPNA|nr:MULTISPECIES: LysR substrate-binding domain-containing protein [Hyphomonas]ABI78429.1 transcriptional regulator, LysR family [Hyphomonas neptunium ATCC 15444]KCZ93114.1 LysR family transcriptional regulator [Hyphomonas hirschiana VP5]